VILSFVLPRLIPGSPLLLSESDIYVLNSSLPEDAFNAFKDYYAPEKPVMEQFIIYIRNIASMDLGYSFHYKMAVSDIILGRIGWTMFLSITSILISAFLGIWLGVSGALKRQGGRLLKAFTFLQAVPVFVTAVIFQLIFSFRLELFPSSGAYTPGIEKSGGYFLIDVIIHSILPIFVLVISQLPSIYILTFNVASKIKDENFVEMARYLNIKNADIKQMYILKNSFPEILSKLNIQFLYAISGTLFVEAVFSYPGMGTLLKISASSRDYPLIQGILLASGLYGILVNMCFESIIKKMSPRCCNE
jgi:peptide/nickel transport system permease protein